MAPYTLFVSSLLVCAGSAFPHLAFELARREPSLGSALGSAVGGLTTTLLGSSSVPDPSNFPYQAPSASDSRSPCPGINSFANHGYIPRSGKNITLQTMITALETAVNFDPTFAISFASGAYTAVGVPSDGALDLNNLTGTALNHPAAMFHSDDTVNKGGDSSANATMVQQMLQDSAAPLPAPPAQYLNTATLAATHIRRLVETGQGGLVANLDLPNEPKEVAECALLLLVLGQVGANGDPSDVLSRRFPKAWADDWFLKNKIPDQFQRSTVAWQQTDFVALTGAIESATHTINTWKQTKAIL